MYNSIKYCHSSIYLFIFIIFPALVYGHNVRSYSDFNTPVKLQLSDTTDSLQWSPPRFDERAEDRRQLVQSLSQRITDPQVLDAMRQVPRHLFVPEPLRSFAYQNRPLPIGHEQTISQPFIVGYMTQLLELSPGEKVLEIGTGSGYQAAVLSELTSKVYTIEIIEELGKRARTRFDSLGYSTIKTKIGDGYNGWKKYAPFDAIILTAAPPEIPHPLIDQLKAGGVLVAPVGSTDSRQVIVKLTKLKNGEIKKEKMLPVRFVPMTGKAQDQ